MIERKKKYFANAKGETDKLWKTKDCYFYHEGGTIPACSYHIGGGLGYCPCDGCEKYIAKADVYKMAKKAVDKE